ncbi:MAG: PIG-L family deacetylase [Saprospiraceae bacterium]
MQSTKLKQPLLFLLLLLGTFQFLNAQTPKRWTSGDIHEGIKKLNFLGSALFVAAHPDDENTAMIAYMANERKARMGYLSLTRGDGGQNLIGPEIRELLGIIRTQELLAARRVDGGQQMFSRANDFGYSKHPDETLKIWNEDEVLSDVVWAIRKWRPDVIINRFDHRTPGTTHGHHTSSAMLSVRAFDLAADPKVYPQQLKYVDTWQPERAFFNTSWFRYGSRAAFAKADKSHMLTVDVGVYYPIKGKSNTEISALSRSMHKCQGFGSVGSRGGNLDYIELVKGSMPKNQDDIFDGINTTWTRVKGGAPIGKMVTSLDASFRYDNPGASVPQLVEIYKKIEALPAGYWRNIKLEETKTLIEASMGLFLEAVADDFSATAGEELELALEMVNRSEAKAQIMGVRILPVGKDTLLNQVLLPNKGQKINQTITLPDDMPITNPYWLNEPAELGMYNVEDQLLRGLPETPRLLKVAFDLNVAGQDLTIEKDVVFKRRDPVAGEVYRPFEVTPPVFVKIPEPVYIFADDEAQDVRLVIKAGKADIKGTVKLDLPEGWRSEPEMADVELSVKEEERTVSFKLFPPKGQSEGQLLPVVELEDGSVYNQELVLIQYDHIPTQTILREAQSKIVKIDIQKEGERIGYIAGAGDAIPQSLQQIGYKVDMLGDGDITVANLNQYDAVIVGIRAYNINERLKFHQPKLLKYVEEGGTMIIQYNTSRGLKVPMEEMGPYPLKLSRDRVTVEEAEVRLLKPDHVVLNFPNKITEKDFEGWVQERGLYFPNEWDDAYSAILSSNDPGETPKDGGLLVAQHGKGYYIYSGYSWFRELPAGVPGAFRLFANMISIGQAPKP